MKLWVAKVLLREYLPLILQALRILDQFTNMAGLDFLSLVLLRYDVLLHSLINYLVVILIALSFLAGMVAVLGLLLPL